MAFRCYEVTRPTRDAAPFRANWIAARRAERQYGRKLREVAKRIIAIITAHPTDDYIALGRLQAALRSYSAAIRPWAAKVAERMLLDVAGRDAETWGALSQEMGVALRKEIATAPTGQAMRGLIATQVELITSLPAEAATRVHDLARAAFSNGRRASEIAADIQAIGGITASRARLIARTEVGRAQTTLTQVRAEHIGSTEFIWRTVGDTDVRPSHKRLDGKTFRWDSPPECDPPHRALPGCIWNCRCFAEPILPSPDAL